MSRSRGSASGSRPSRTRAASPSTADLFDALVESFEETLTDVVALKGATAAEQADEAKTLGCDYVLTNTVSSLRDGSQVPLAGESRRR